MYEDSRCTLVKLIYGMSNSQQTTFRTRFPAGIPDSEVPAAIEYARAITGVFE